MPLANMIANRQRIFGLAFGFVGTLAIVVSDLSNALATACSASTATAFVVSHCNWSFQQ
jgi:hypothetical protein